MSGPGKPVVLAMIMIAVLFWAVGIMITLSRTIIPYGIDAETVITIRVRQEHQPGRDDLTQIMTDRRTLRVDPNAAACVKAGDRVTKAAWSMIVTGPDGTACTLGWPRQLRTVMLVPLLVAAGCGGSLLLARWLLRRSP
ncbi:hypothetical protein [Microlunatus sp. GCM10028923]|uniref:hypothetical protein n=1 Tax=Microlunatus sp. GCM10028923 TaxID=3273400 RepID=UPI00360D9C47